LFILVARARRAHAKEACILLLHTLSRPRATGTVPRSLLCGWPYATAAHLHIGSGHSRRKIISWQLNTYLFTLDANIIHPQRPAAAAAALNFQLSPTRALNIRLFIEKPTAK
jgi:hypothetical protein